LGEAWIAWRHLGGRILRNSRTILWRHPSGGQPHPDVWLAKWDDLQIILPRGERLPEEVYTLTVARTKREARSIMEAGVLGFADIEGVPKVRSVSRMPSPGWAGGYPAAIESHLSRGYRFVFPSEILLLRETAMLICRILDPSRPF
jgi:hypothetical protein